MNGALLAPHSDKPTEKLSHILGNIDEFGWGTSEDIETRLSRSL